MRDEACRLSLIVTPSITTTETAAATSAPPRQQLDTTAAARAVVVVPGAAAVVAVELVRPMGALRQQHLRRSTGSRVAAGVGTVMATPRSMVDGRAVRQVEEEEGVEVTMVAIMAPTVALQLAQGRGREVPHHAPRGGAMEPSTQSPTMVATQLATATAMYTNTLCSTTTRRKPQLSKQ